MHSAILFFAVILLGASAYSLAGHIGVVGVNLDDSYPLVLEYAASRGAQFGTDVVYTYGPLGWLVLASGLGGFVWQRMVFALLVSVVSGYVWWRTLKRLPVPAWLPVIVWLALFPSVQLVLAGIAVLLMEDAKIASNSRKLEWGFLSAFCGLLALTKFTEFLFVASILCCVVLQALRMRRPRQAVIVSAGVLITFFAGWLLAGQSLANLPAYLWNSLQITTGFSAMTVEPPANLLAAGVVCGAVLLGVMAVSLAKTQDRAAMGLRLLPLFAGAFLSFKHGFVRADNHMSLFFSKIPMFMVLVWCVVSSAKDDFQKHSKSRVIYAGAAAVLTIVSIVAIWWVSLRMDDSASVLRSRPLAILSDHVQRLEETPKELAAQNKLPKLEALIGAAPVDIFNFQQGIAFLNHFNLRSRPVFQSFSAYTPSLQRLNRAFYDQPARPEFVMFRPETVDHRLIWLDDAPTALHLLTDWQPAAREKGFLLLKPGKTAEGTWQELAGGNAKWGKKIEMPQQPPGSLLTLAINAKRSFYGSVNRFAYQGPNLNLKLNLSDGSTLTRNFIPEMSADGVLVSPFMESADEILSFYGGLAAAPKATHFSLMPWDGKVKHFASTYSYSWKLWTPAPGADRSKVAELVRPMLYPFLPCVPGVSKPALLTALRDGEEVGLARAPIHLEFTPPADAKGIAGELAIESDSSNLGSEQVTIRLLALDSAGKEIVNNSRDYTAAAKAVGHLLNASFPAGSDVKKIVIDVTSTAKQRRAYIQWKRLAWAKQQS